jgi:bacterioferritin
MSQNQNVVKALNVILKNELTAINQYFLHAKLLNHQGFGKLGKKVYEESIDEMKHADALAERILMIEGLPNFQDLGKLHIGETPQEMLESDLEMEHRAFADLVKSREICEKEGDTVSQLLLEDIMQSEELHRDWLRKQLDIITAVGIQNYLHQQMEV